MAPIANPTTIAHVLVTFGGTFGTGPDAEIWQCGVKMGLAGTGNDHSLQIGNLASYASSIKGGLQTWFTTAGYFLRRDFNLTFLKVANIAGGAIGKNLPGNKYAGTVDSSGGPNPAVLACTGFGGSAAASTSPPFCTAKITWRSTAVAKGRPSSQGGIYVPYAVASGTNRFPTADVNALVNCGKGLLTALSKDQVDGTHSVRPILCGRDGTSALVDQVSVGDVIDVQRRRKNALREVYTTSAWS